MKRIEAYLKGKVQELKISNRKAKINSALNNARLNLQEDMCNKQIELEDCMQELTSSGNIGEVISKMVDIFLDMEDIETSRNALMKVESYLSEEIQEDEIK